MLAPILDTPLVVWTCRAAGKCSLADRVIVATDDKEILNVVRAAGFEAQMTNVAHKSGTDRIWEVAANIDCKWIVNLQGDEPLMTGSALDALIQSAIDSENYFSPIEMATLVRKISSEEAGDPNRVKAVTDLSGNALYFSRSLIPYKRTPAIDSSERQTYILPEYLLHVGVYLYRKDVLERLISLDPSPLEKAEMLEQLRALENGISIRCIKVEDEFISVDTERDVPKVEAALRAKTGSGTRNTHDLK